MMSSCLYFCLIEKHDYGYIRNKKRKMLYMLIGNIIDGIKYIEDKRNNEVTHS